MLGEPSELVPLRDKIQLALDRAGNVMTIEDLYWFVLTGGVQLWITPSASACMFTEVVNYTRVKALCWLYTAGNMKDALKMVPSIAQWAIAQGCTRAQFFGWPGWFRAFRKVPYSTAVFGFAELSELTDGR